MKLRKIINNPPKDYYSRLAQVESNNNPLAKAKTSSAAGLYQFTEGTWNQLTDELGLNYTLDDRFDPEKSRKVVQEFTKRNERTLKNKLGRKPNDAELYLAHFSGAGGASKLLDTVQNNPNASVTDFVSEAALKANKNVFFNKDGSPKKAYEIYNWSAKKFDSPILDPKETSLASNTNRERREVSIDNTAVRRPKIPSLSTGPINPNYAELPEAEKQEAAKENSISEDQIRQLLDKERKATESRFLSAFQNQNAAESEDYVPQPIQEDLSHLYNYIKLQD